jgi:prepilin-type processing-associated H-X9-DG protein
MPVPARTFTATGWATVSIVLGLLIPASAPAQQKPAPRLSRFIPAEGLAFLVEHDGFAAAPGAWNATAANKLLGDTPLGPMLQEIATQLADRALQSAQGPPLSGKELIELLTHAAERGFAFGFAPAPGGGGGQPRTLVLVLRDAKGKPVFERGLGRFRMLNPPQAQPTDGPGGRKVWLAGPNMRWWFEGNDFVFSFNADPERNLVLEAVEGKTPDASTSPSYQSVEKLDGGTAPVGRLFLDLSVLPPLPPRARELGLDAIRTIEARWGIQDRAIVVTAGVHAPRPRQGILALFDQPPLPAGTDVSLRDPAADSVLLSLDLPKLADTITALAGRDNPQAQERLDQFARQFRASTGLSLRDDVLAKLGPRMAFLPGGSSIGNVMAMWFRPPDFGLVAELKDPRAFAANLDRLVASANRELRSAGGMVPLRPGTQAREGTQYAEFRKLKAPEHGYVLAVPPAVLPTPAGLRPTVLLDPERGLFALGGSPAAARRALVALRLEGAPAPPAWGPDALLVARSDPSQSLPELLVNLPSIVQFIAFAASQQPGPPGSFGGPQRGGNAALRLEIDPDSIPDVEQLRPLLFPSRFTLSANDTSIRLSAYQAFPLPVPPITGGMETPVLIALLLPAVQSAREAARRAQCVNDLKQIALACLNYESANGAYPPAALTDAGGKPLLSWRVAILPYIDQKVLYDKFHLDEPWDSPHNRQLLPYMPRTYLCPSRPDSGAAGVSTTTYRVFAGKGTLFEPGHAARIAEVTDGTVNTLMVVEAKDAVPWTKPDELPFDLEGGRGGGPPLFGAGSFHPGGLNAVFADGSVRFIKLSINPQTLRSLITKHGGEIVNPDGF